MIATQASCDRFRSSGIELAATVVGTPGHDTVVFLHGGGQTRHAWDTTAAAVQHAGWCTVAFDTRGHGDSDRSPDGDYGLDALVADLVHVIEELPAPPVLVGASLGGITALVAEARHHLARALVLVDVAPRLESEGIDRIRSFMTARPDGFASLDEAADAIAEYNPHRPRTTNPGGLRRVLRQRPDGRWVWHWDPAFMWTTDATGKVVTRPRTDPALLEEAARAITIPTLLLRGKHSDLLSEQGARHLLEILPRARYLDVAGAGHMVAGDRNDAFADALVAFLRELRDR